MNTYFLFFIFSVIFIFSCSESKEQAAIESKETYKQIVAIETTSKPLNRKIIRAIKNDTSVIQLKKINFNLLDIRLNDVDKRELIIIKNKSIQYKIDLLTGEDYMGFAVNHIRDIGKGFEISIEFGKYYYSRNFEFTYQDSAFLLTKIETHSIDYNNNNNKKEEIRIMEKPININNFRLEDYLY